jgi:hypothetical protein
MFLNALVIYLDPAQALSDAETALAAVIIWRRHGAIGLTSDDTLWLYKTSHYGVLNSMRRGISLALSLLYGRGLLL